MPYALYSAWIHACLTVLLPLLNSDSVPIRFLFMCNTCLHCAVLRGARYGVGRVVDLVLRGDVLRVHDFGIVECI